MSPMSRSFAITSASSLLLASSVSVALLNSKSSREPRFTIAGFFGSGFGSGFATGFRSGTACGFAAGGGGGGRARAGRGGRRRGCRLRRGLRRLLRGARAKRKRDCDDDRARFHLVLLLIFCRERAADLSTVARL